MMADIHCYFHDVTETQNADFSILVCHNFGAYDSVVIDEVSATGGGLSLQCLIEDTLTSSGDKAMPAILLLWTYLWTDSMCMTPSFLL